MKEKTEAPITPIDKRLGAFFKRIEKPFMTRMHNTAKALSRQDLEILIDKHGGNGLLNGMLRKEYARKTDIWRLERTVNATPPDEENYDRRFDENGVPRAKKKSTDMAAATERKGR